MTTFLILLGYSFDPKCTLNVLPREILNIILEVSKKKKILKPFFDLKVDDCTPRCLICNLVKEVRDHPHYEEQGGRHLLINRDSSRAVEILRAEERETYGLIEEDSFTYTVDISGYFLVNEYT